MKTIDQFLNKVTMYRLVAYELGFLLVAAIALGALGFLSYSPAYLAYSTVFLFAVCFVVNKIFAHFFNAPSNDESTWITALILALIITPPVSLLDTTYLPLAFWAGAWAMASKYIFAIGKKHLFNPAALGVAVTSLALGLSASWWVGTPVMVPFVIFGGALIVRKIRRVELLSAFFFVFLAGIVLMGGARTLVQSFFYTAVFFFATVMLTEPLTTPPTRRLRLGYGALVGLLSLPNANILGFYFAPELALLVGNVFTYFVSPKKKLVLSVKEIATLSPDVVEFTFTPDQPSAYKPGQYMEWTLSHDHTDSRGLRRYFTLSSSPTDLDIKMGIKFYDNSSTFKKALLNLQLGSRIIASHLAGDFTLPKKKDEKLTWIAGGIGITPFTSMVRYLVDKKEQ